MTDTPTLLATTAGIEPGMFINVAAGPANTSPDYDLKTNAIFLVLRIMGQRALLVTSINIAGHTAGDLKTIQLSNKAAVVVDLWSDKAALCAQIVSLHEFASAMATGEKPAFNAAVYEKAKRTVAMLLDLLPKCDRPVLPQLTIQGGDGQRLVAVRPDVLATEIADQVIRIAGKRLALAIVQMANDQRNGR